MLSDDLIMGVKYAIGEILLVVIGILIALAINTFKMRLEDRQQEKYFLNRFLFDFENDINQLENCISKTNIQLSNLDSIVEILDERHNVSKFFNLQRSIHDVLQFKPNKSTYDECISSNTIGLINNDLIREQIFGYYREIINYGTDEAMIRIRDDILLPYINSNIYNRRESIGFIFATDAELRPLDLEQLANDENYYAVLISAKGRHVQIINWSIYLERAIGLRDLIQSELDQLGN